MYRVDFEAIRPIEAVPQIAPRPILFIHGKADETIPVSHAYRLFGASPASSQNQLWIVPKAGHTRAYKTHPEEYISKITIFLNGALASP